jgi:DNA-binding NtrC family response regulator
MAEPGAATNAEAQASSCLERDAPIRVLVVDDEAGVRNAIARVLRNAGMVPSTADGGASALDLLEREAFDVALLDVRMPGMTGLQLLTRMKASRHPAEVIMMTAFADIPTTVSAVKEGAYGFLTKPFPANESIVIEVLNAASHKSLRERAECLQRELAELRPGEMVGGCPQMREVNRIIACAASADSPVLVFGESGTGKELFARAVHRRSRRACKPLITVDCGSLPKHLVEGELFGHANPSPTPSRAGYFERANGGTIFLDGVGELPPTVQSKLLRTLESGEVKPVGANAVRQVDVRVIAASSPSLSDAMSAGTFREDLFHRLNSVAVHLPPLRERADDVLRLAQHFVQKHAKHTGRTTPRLGSDAVFCLTRYEWPGNVRELEHAIERALVFEDGDVITAVSLPPEIATRLDDRASGEIAMTASGEIAMTATLPPPGATARSIEDVVSALALHELAYGDAKRRVLAEFTEAYVAALLRITGGDVSEAARRSGLDSSNFGRLVRSDSAGEAAVDSGKEK